MKPISLFILFIVFSNLWAQDLSIPFEHNKNRTATYRETIDFYKKLASQYPQQLQLIEQGPTDSGLPLHLAVLSADGDCSPTSIRAKGKNIFFINNAIHAGEPCGVDATMMLFKLACVKLL